MNTIEDMLTVVMAAAEKGDLTKAFQLDFTQRFFSMIAREDKYKQEITRLDADISAETVRADTAMECHKQMADSIASIPPVYIKDSEKIRITGDAHLQEGLDLTAQPCVCGNRLSVMETMTCGNCGGAI